MALLELKEVFFAYESGKAILQDTCFTVDKGDFSLILGPNGSGKTTLAKILAGVLQPEKGDYNINGQKRKEFSLGQMGQKIGFVQQNPAMQFFTSSVEKEVAFGLWHRGESQDVVEEKVQLVLQNFALEKIKNQHPLTLSQGERKRLAVACAIVLNPLILILDEPTAGLDWKNKYNLLEYLKRVNDEEKITIILITHDWETVVPYASKLLFWAEGKILYQGKTEDVLLQSQLSDNLPPFFRLAKELGRNFSLPFCPTPASLAEKIKMML